MTTTSPGTHEFPVKYVVVAIAAAVFVAAIFAIAQWVGTESQQIVASPSEAQTAAAESYTGPSGLTQAFDDGKLEAGLVPTPSQAVTGSDPAPETVLIEGQGSNYDALIAGKFAMDFNALNSGVQYARAVEAAPNIIGLSAALAEGKLDAGLIVVEVTAEPLPATTRTPTLAGGHQQ